MSSENGLTLHMSALQAHSDRELSRLISREDCPPASPIQLRALLLSSLIEVFNTEHVSYCLLSGYRPSLEEAASDVDFMVHPRDAARLPSLIQRAAHSSGGTVVQCFQHETTAPGQDNHLLATQFTLRF